MRVIEAAMTNPVPVLSDDEAYRIVEEMGLGLTFRSCSCGQLPCARLRPLRDALKTARDTSANDAAIRMRDLCVAKVKLMADEWQILWDKDLTDDHSEKIVYVQAANQIILSLESLTLEGEQEKQ